MGNTTLPVLTIIGATSSGKSDVAVDAALRYGGEVISADSRQVYQSLFYTTGKISKESMRGVPHHMLDVAPVGTQYTVHSFMTAATACIDAVYARGALPILVGGTGFYIDAVLFRRPLGGVPPDPAYRAYLEQQDPEVLCALLQEKDSDAYCRIDTRNTRRVIRALEILHVRGSMPVDTGEQRFTHRMIGLCHRRDYLRERIAQRIDDRFDGMVEEVRALLEAGVDPLWLDGLGLECRHISRMFTASVSKEDTRTNLLRATMAYAKRQETWWRRYPATWFYPHEYGDMYRHLDSLYRSGSTRT